MQFRAGRRTFDLNRQVLVMGILNTTPDSFSDGGVHVNVDTAVGAALQMLADGADIVDVGGESSRPGAEPVSAEEECRRVVPVIRELRQASDCVISVDTWKSQVAAEAVEAGADVINDISGFRRDPDLRKVAADLGTGCVAMHMRGTPETMQAQTDYRDIVADINEYFSETLEMMADAGVNKECVSLDPGIGFSKTAEQNLNLIARLCEFGVHGRPLLLGPSRKSFIGKVLKISTASERTWGTAATVACCVANGARIIRVHDVAAMSQVCRMTRAIVDAGKEE